VVLVVYTADRKRGRCNGIRKLFEVLKSDISSIECYIPVIAPPKFPDGYPGETRGAWRHCGSELWGKTLEVFERLPPFEDIHKEATSGKPSFTNLILIRNKLVLI
jgi:hypothetical protein